MIEDYDSSYLKRFTEAIAYRIIEGRPYKSIDSVIEVDGIGAGKLAKIRPFLMME